MKPGSRVQVKSLKKSGTVLEIIGNKAIVSISNFRVQLYLDDLELINTKSSKTKKVSHSAKTTQANLKSKTIDYHGKTVNEMLADLEDQINQAYQQKIGSLEIITGRGTGKLKAAALNYLKNSDLKLNYQVSLNNESVIYLYL